MTASWKAVILAAAILVLMVAPLIWADGSSCHMYFILYGDPGCPACQAMSSFLEKNYGAECLEFRSIEEEQWRGNYDALISLLKLDAYVPLVGLLVDGKLRAISQGAVRDKAFWDNLAETNSSTQYIPVYGYRNNRRVMERIPFSEAAQYFVPITPTKPVGQGTQGSRRFSAVLPALILVSAILVIWLRWRK